MKNNNKTINLYLIHDDVNGTLVSIRTNDRLADYGDAFHHEPRTEEIVKATTYLTRQGYNDVNLETIYIDYENIEDIDNISSSLNKDLKVSVNDAIVCLMVKDEPLTYLLNVISKNSYTREDFEKYSGLDSDDLDLLFPAPEELEGEIDLTAFEEEQNKEKEAIELLLHSVENEGFDYAIRFYSSFDGIKDPEFRRLRDQYINSAEALENWIESKQQ